MAERAVLIDTHILIWMMNGDTQLSVAARKLVNQAASNGSLLVAAITIWEVAMLVKAQRIEIGRPVQQWVDDALSAPGVVLVPLSPKIAIESCSLPGQFHGDPADRMIVATARIEGAALLSRDKRITAYAKSGHLQLAQ